MPAVMSLLLTSGTHAQHGKCDRHGHKLAGESPAIALKGGNMQKMERVLKKLSNLTM